MNLSPSEEWITVRCGEWTLACNIMYGGSCFYRKIPEIGWVVADADSVGWPKKSTERHLTRYVFKLWGRLGASR